MKSVMLIQLPHFYEGTSRPPTLYPLGFGYLVSVLKHDYHLIPMDLWLEGADVPKALKMIERKRPDIFCISVYSTQYPYFKELVTALKLRYPEKTIIAGGPGGTFSYSVLLGKTPVDYCVIGEGEETLPELLKNLDSPNKVKGIAYRSEERIVLAQKRPQIKDIDLLPLPDREFFDLERYIRNNKKENGEFKKLRAVNVIAGRGCPYNCTYCSKTFEGARFRSIEKIAEEVAHIKDKYNLQAVEFNDELVVVNKARTLELCLALKKIGVKWGCQGRINLVDEQILTAMKESHCLYIGYGVESYSQRILDQMKKHIKVERILPIIEMTKRIGIKPIIQYMYGFPGEDQDSIAKSFEFFRKIDHPYVGFTTTPLPGTELYDQAMRDDKIGDEETYLERLTGGYNRSTPLVNLTAFSDQEFITNKNRLQNAVDGGFYRRHPFVHLANLLSGIRNLTLRVFRNPQYYMGKFIVRSVSSVKAKLARVARRGPNK